MAVDAHEKVDFRRLTQVQCAALHGVDVRTIRRWAEVGMPRGSDDSFDGPATIRWRVKNTNSCGVVDVAYLRDRIRRGWG